MSWDVQWTDRALRVASRLDRPTRERITKQVESFAATGEGDVKGLKGKYRGFFRLRVSEWRVLISKEGDHLLIRAIRPRGDAY